MIKWMKGVIEKFKTENKDVHPIDGSIINTLSDPIEIRGEDTDKVIETIVSVLVESAVLIKFVKDVAEAGEFKTIMNEKRFAPTPALEISGVPFNIIEYKSATDDEFSNLVNECKQLVLFRQKKITPSTLEQYENIKKTVDKLLNKNKELEEELQLLNILLDVDGKKIEAIAALYLFSGRFYNLRTSLPKFQEVKEYIMDGKILNIKSSSNSDAVKYNKIETLEVEFPGTLAALDSIPKQSNLQTVQLTPMDMNAVNPIVFPKILNEERNALIKTIAENQETINTQFIKFRNKLIERISLGVESHDETKLFENVNKETIDTIFNPLMDLLRADISKKAKRNPCGIQAVANEIVSYYTCDDSTIAVSAQKGETICFDQHNKSNRSLVTAKIIEPLNKACKSLPPTPHSEA